MSSPVTSLETIARHASDSARLWNGRGTPPNPYDEHLHPEHHAEWKRRFEIALVRHSAPETEIEASA